MKVDERIRVLNVGRLARIKRRGGGGQVLRRTPDGERYRKTDSSLNDTLYKICA